MTITICSLAVALSRAWAKRSLEEQSRKAIKTVWRRLMEDEDPFDDEHQPRAKGSKRRK